jgi:hypothetical protein
MKVSLVLPEQLTFISIASRAGSGRAAGMAATPSKLAAVHLPHPARILAAAAATAALCLAATGCGAFDRAFGKQEAVVQFQPDTPASTILKARAACSHLAGAHAEPIPKHALAVDLPDDIRYEVGSASDAQLARLQQCLERFPSVVGIEFSSPSGD